MKPFLVENPAATVGPWAILPTFAQYEAARLDTVRNMVTAALGDPERIAAVLEARGADTDRPRAYTLPRVAEGVAKLPLEGVLRSDHSWWDQVLALWGFELPPLLGELEAATRDAIDDKRVHTLAVWGDSPGGHVIGTDLVADAVWDARVAGMRTVGFGRGMVASACLWILSQCAETAVTGLCQVGSVGTRFSIVDSSEAARLRGHRVIDIASAELKGAGTPGTPITDAMVADWKRIIGETNELFVEAMARGRDVSTKEVEERWADARVHVGRHAVELDLIGWVAKERDVLAALTDGTPLTQIGAPSDAQAETAPQAPIAAPPSAETDPAEPAATTPEGAAGELDDLGADVTSADDVRTRALEMLRTDPERLAALTERAMQRRRDARRLADSGHFTTTKG